MLGGTSQSLKSARIRNDSAFEAMDQSFFDESKEQSEIKTAIVSKYFFAWANVILGTSPQKIAYLDLFCGPGRYKDGTESTPLKIIRRAAADPKLVNNLETYFNDLDVDNIASLQGALDSLPETRLLKHRPVSRANSCY